MPAETLGSALSWAVAELQSAHVDSPRLAAEVLLAYVLECERPQVIGHSRDPLATGPRVEFEALVGRHVRGEPLSYLTGIREFYGLPFLVTQDVLIPRPETEFLVEKAIELARKRTGDLHFVDIGTGSGCIAVSVALQLPDARGWATDLSQVALAVARENACRLGVQSRLEFICGDLLDCFSARPVFDLILSNPPYVPRYEMASLPPTVREYEPRAALDGGEAGLEIYRRLVPQAAGRLTDAGCLLLEIGAGQAQEVQKLIGGAGLVLTETIRDLQSIPRCLVAGKRR